MNRTNGCLKMQQRVGKFSKQQRSNKNNKIARLLIPHKWFEYGFDTFRVVFLFRWRQPALEWSPWDDSIIAKLFCHASAVAPRAGPTVRICPGCKLIDTGFEGNNRYESIKRPFTHCFRMSEPMVWLNARPPLLCFRMNGRIIASNQAVGSEFPSIPIG